MPTLLRVEYHEPFDTEWEEPYTTCAYPPSKAKALVPVLEKMGCVRIKLVKATPLREKPSGD